MKCDRCKKETNYLKDPSYLPLWDKKREKMQVCKDCESFFGKESGSRIAKLIFNTEKNILTIKTKH